MCVCVFQGSGSLTGEHWLGNELVYQLTKQWQYTFRLELTDLDGELAFSQYKFHLSSRNKATGSELSIFTKILTPDNL